MITTDSNIHDPTYVRTWVHYYLTNERNSNGIYCGFSSEVKNSLVKIEFDDYRANSSGWPTKIGSSSCYVLSPSLAELCVTPNNGATGTYKEILEQGQIYPLFGNSLVNKNPLAIRGLANNSNANTYISRVVTSTEGYQSTIWVILATGNASLQTIGTTSPCCIGIIRFGKQ